MTKYLTVAETAKMIRAALKESFPGVEFSVRSSKYSGGASVSIGWTDGPTAKMVDSVTSVFTGAYFDGSIDYKGYTKAMIDGQMVSFGADYIHTRREHSDALRATVQAAFDRKFGHIAAQDGQYLADRLFNEMLHNRSTYLTPRASKTAGKVIYCGNDGYSQVGALAV